LRAVGKPEEAISAYRECLAIRRALLAKEPDNPRWQSDLGSITGRLASALRESGKLSEALESVRESRAIFERLAMTDPNNAQWRGDLQAASARTGNLAYAFVKAGDFAAALKVADEAISFAPSMIWLYGHRAHALMFLGRVDEARALYLRYRGDKAMGNTSWEAFVLGYFADLREGGLTHPLMDEIEQLFGGQVKN